MKFEVKALIPNIETPSLVIEADNEWMARTIYMAKSNLKLSGEFVDWSIKQV